MNVIVIGAGAAGLFCAMEAAKRGRSVLILDHSQKIGEKIRISGGGRCNFTNLQARPENYISQNPHFCRSALARFTPQDFLALLEKYAIAWEERENGQLFCVNSAIEVVDMLQKECEKYAVQFITGCEIKNVEQTGRGFLVQTDAGEFEAESLVIATGGLSIPKIGASPLGYGIAEKFNMGLTEIKPGLVPFVFTPGFEALSGISVGVIARCNESAFRADLLFTHRGLSGPAILQISSYWNPGDEIEIDLLPDMREDSWLDRKSKSLLSNAMPLPKKLCHYLCARYFKDKPVNQLTSDEMQSIYRQLKHWKIRPAGTEGYRKAEVTVGGVDTEGLSSKTMESKKVPGLYFIGEVVDVTGHLGGFNFQWAWASGFAAGQYA